MDAQAILSAVVGLPLPSGFTAANGDANCDGTLGAVDAQIVLSFVVGLNVSQFCVGTLINSAPVATVSVTLASSGEHHNGNDYAGDRRSQGCRGQRAFHRARAIDLDVEHHCRSHGQLDRPSDSCRSWNKHNHGNE